MKLLFVLLTVLGISSTTNAQFRPAQQQYVPSSGAFTNPGFEQGFKGWTITGCTQTSEAHIPYLNRSLKLTCAGETFSVKQETTSFAGMGSEGIASCRVKATAAGAEVRTLANGAEVYAKTVAAGDFVDIKDKIIFHSTSNGIEVASDAAYTGDIYIDDCNIQPLQNNYVQEVSQAQFIGDAFWEETASCTWAGGSGAYADFSFNVSCPAPTIRGQLADAGEDRPSILITNARTDGYYRVEAQGFFYFTAGTDGFIRLSDGTQAGGITAINSSSDERMFGSVYHDFKFSTSGDKKIILQAKSSSVVSILNDDAGRRLQYSVHFYPDSKTLAAVQSTELTAETDNIITASIGNVAGTYNFTNYSDKTFTITRFSAGEGSINYSSLNLTAPPRIIANPTKVAYSGAISTIEFLNVGPTGAGYTMKSNNTPADEVFDIMIIKSEPDYNKNQTVAGVFENINSTDLVKVEAKADTGQPIPSGGSHDVVYNNEILDQSNAYDNTTGIFTAPRASDYLVCAGVLYNTNSMPANTIFQLFLHRNGPTFNEIEYLDLYENEVTAGTYIRLHGCETVKLDKDEQIKIRTGHNAGASRSLEPNQDWQRLNITELPSTESIVRNLDGADNVVTLAGKGQLQGHNGTNTVTIPAATGSGQFPMSDTNAESGITWTNNIAATLNPVTDWEDVQCTSTFVSFATNTCKMRRVGDELEVQGKIETSNTTNNVQLKVFLPNGYTIDPLKMAATSAVNYNVGQASLFENGVQNRGARLRYLPSDLTGLEVVDMSGDNVFFGVTGTNPFIFNAGDSVHFRYQVPIQGWGSGVDVAIQEKELNAYTANELSANLDSSCNVISENFDWINGDCVSGGTGICTCTPNDNVFTVTPSVTCSGSELSASRLISCELAVLTATSLRFDIEAVNASGYTRANEPIQIMASKQGVDVNNKNIVAGTFENVNSTDLVSVKAVRDTTQGLLTAEMRTVIYDVELEDNSGSYDNTTGVFTAPRDGNYLVCAAMLWDSFAWGINNVNEFEILTSTAVYKLNREEITTTDTSYYDNKGCVEVYLAAGETAEARAFHNNGGTLNIFGGGGARNHNYISIKEMPTTESIIRNLQGKDNVVTLSAKGQLQGHNGTRTVTIQPAQRDGLFPISDSTADAGISWSESIASILNPVEDWIEYTPTTLDGTGVSPNATFHYRRVGDSIEVEGIVDYTNTSGGTGTLAFSAPSGVAIDTSKTQGQGNGTANYYVGEATYFNDSSGASYSGKVNLNVAGNVFYIYGDNGRDIWSSSASVPTAYSALSMVKITARYPVQGWSSGVDVAISNKELTANTANELSAFISDSGGINSENYDWIDGNCSQSTGTYTCNLKPGVFNVIPSCRSTVTNQAAGNDRCVNIETISTTQIVYRTFVCSTGANGSYRTSLSCSKQGNDVNKSQVILGSFENINSTDLVKVEAGRSGSQLMQNGVSTTLIFNVEKADTHNAYDHTTGVFTAPKAGWYSVCANWLFANDGTWSHNVIDAKWVMSQSDDHVKEYSSSAGVWEGGNYCSNVELVAGETVEFQLNQARGTDANIYPSGNYTILTISQLPDYEAVVANIGAQFGELSAKAFPVTDWEDSTVTSNLSINTNTLSKVRRVGDTAEFRVELDFVGPNTEAATVDLTLPYTIDTTKLISTSDKTVIDSVVTLADNSSGNFIGKVRYLSNNSLRVVFLQDSGTSEIEVPANPSSSLPFPIDNNDKINITFKVPIQEWTSELDAVIQNKQLNASTVNEFSASITNTGVVTEGSFDWIDGNFSTGTGTGIFQVNFVADIFTQAPICHCSNTITGSGAENGCSVEDSNISATSITVRTFNNEGVLHAPFNLTCKKVGSDFNKNQVIVGTFEQIKTTDIITLEAQGSVGGSLTAGTTNLKYTEISDPYDTWDGERFTAPREGYYIINGAMSYTGSVNGEVRLYLDDTTYERSLSYYNSSKAENYFTGIVKLNAGQVASFRMSAAGDQNNSLIFNYLHIQEMPDTAAIVKNLNDNNNIECQTKFLTGDITSNTDPNEADLTFNNLTVGKKYSVGGIITFGSMVNDSIALDMYNGGSLLGKVATTATDGANSGFYAIPANYAKFTATGTTLTFDAVSISVGEIRGNSTFDETHIQLCELPDNTILNSTKFD